MDTALKALAAPVRRQILALVKDRELSAGQIAARFSLTRPAISQHLGALKGAGLLEERRQGTSRLYRLRAEGLAPVRDLLEALAVPRAPAAPTPRAPSARLEREIELPLRPHLAFAWLVDPERLARWWRAPEQWDPRPGGRLAVDGVEGTFARVEAPARLQLRVGELEVALEVEAEGLGSKVRVRQEGPSLGAWSPQGWEHYLPRLLAVSRGWDPGDDEWVSLT